MTVTCSGEGGWTVVSGGDHVAQENKTGIQPVLQDSDNDIYSVKE